MSDVVIENTGLTTLEGLSLSTPVRMRPGPGAALTVPRAGKPPIVASAPLPADFVALGFGDVG